MKGVALSPILTLMLDGDHDGCQLLVDIGVVLGETSEANQSLECWYELADVHRSRTLTRRVDKLTLLFALLLSDKTRRLREEEETDEAELRLVRVCRVSRYMVQLTAAGMIWRAQGIRHCGVPVLVLSTPYGIQKPIWGV